MSKKKSTKSDKINIAKNITMDMSQNVINHQELRKQHHIWLWLILFCPIGIYKSIKHKCFSKPINILLICTLLLCLILGIDNYLYPDRVIDKNIKTSFGTISDKYDLGVYRFGKRIGTFENKYIIYSVISTKGEYDLYISNASGKNINAILQLTPERKEISITDSFDTSLKNVYPEILRLFTDNESLKKYGEIQEIEESLDNSQTIKCSNGTFMFQINSSTVTGVYKVNDDKSIEEVYKNSNGSVILPDEISDVLKKNNKKMGNLGSVISYSLNSDNREYIIRMTNGNYHKLTLYDNKTIEIYNADNNQPVNDENTENEDSNIENNQKLENNN